MSKIRKFIEDNDISFDEGNRNSTITKLIGYGQYLGLTMLELKEELKSEIEADSFIAEEIERLWNYCKVKNYKNWWDKQTAYTV